MTFFSAFSLGLSLILISSQLLSAPFSVIGLSFSLTHSHSLLACLLLFSCSCLYASCDFENGFEEPLPVAFTFLHPRFPLLSVAIFNPMKESEKASFEARHHRSAANNRRRGNLRQSESEGRRKGINLINCLIRSAVGGDQLAESDPRKLITMANIVRQSKFRHVYCKQIKQDQCIQDVRITEVSWDSQFCAVNPKFIAVVNKGAGGPFLVIPVNKAGRIDKDIPFVDAHKAACLEVHWCPFNDHVIASCSEDTTAKVWLIPEHGLLRTLHEPVVELNGHQKRVNTLAWHPTANNILITAGGENKLLLWNVGTGEALLEIAGHPDQIWSVSFNYDGSKFVTTCKDRMIRVLDSHTGNVLSMGTGHEGVKPQRAIFTKEGHVFTTGFTKRSERLYALRPADNLAQPLMQDELDTSNAVLFPLYDEDSGLCYLVGKGDCAIRYYEINNEPPFVHYINTHTTSEPQRGFAFMPKRGVSSLENEINRIYKVTTKGVIDILQFFVPRKSDLWQADLYPDTRSTVPALSAEQFIEGKNAPPNMMAVNPEAAKAGPKVQVAKKANILAQMPPQQEHPPEPPPTQRAPQQQQRAAPVRHDEDTGIVRTAAVRQEPSPPEQQAPNPMVPRQQVQLRSREVRDEPGGAQTAGQRRAAAELDRIRREQNRSGAGEPEGGGMTASSTTTPSASRRTSNSSTAAGTGNLEEELAKIKVVLRQHERRIRLLEDQLADTNMANAYGL